MTREPTAQETSGVRCQKRKPCEHSNLFQIKPARVVEIERQPGDIEPPHRVSKKSRQNDGPRLTKSKQFQPGNLSFIPGRRLSFFNQSVLFGGDCPVPLRAFVKQQPRSEEHTSELQSLAYLVC